MPQNEQLFNLIEQKKKEIYLLKTTWNKKKKKKKEEGREKTNLISYIFLQKKKNRIFSFNL